MGGYRQSTDGLHAQMTNGWAGNIVSWLWSAQLKMCSSSDIRDNLCRELGEGRDQALGRQPEDPALREVRPQRLASLAAVAPQELVCPSGSLHPLRTHGGATQGRRGWRKERDCPSHV